MTGSFALAVGEEGPDDEETRWSGHAAILAPSWLAMPIVTVTMLGVQTLWSVEMSYASPFLLSLGLSKSWMSLVFMAGPLSGLLVQPLTGILADKTRSRFGRRRPYMLAGTLICITAMLTLGYARPIAAILGMTNAKNWLAIWVAVISIYCIDFSVNAVMAVDRALLVDLLPTSKQASATAWAARMGGVGSVAGFYIGNVDLVENLPILGKEQIQALSVIAAFILLAAHLVTAFSVTEKVLLSAPRTKKSLAGEFKEIWENFWILPQDIKDILLIQFCAWIGWFPVLFYSTIYVTEVYKRNTVEPDPADINAVLAFEATSTRLGTRALLYQSLVALAANALLPFVVKKPRTNMSPVTRTWKMAMTLNLSTLWAASHLLFVVCMASTFFIATVEAATVMITITGLSWAVSMWAPFSLLGEAILSDPSNTASTGHRAAESIQLGDVRRTMEERQTLFSNSEYENQDDDDEPPRTRRMSPTPQQSPTGARLFPPLRIDNGASQTKGLAAKAGVVLGIHNVFIVIPQFIATAMSTVLFAIFEPGVAIGGHGGSAPLEAGSLQDLSTNTTTSTSSKGVNAVAITFQIGGLSTIAAFIFAWRLSRELRYK